MWAVQKKAEYMLSSEKMVTSPNNNKILMRMDVNWGSLDQHDLKLAKFNGHK